MLIVGRLSEIDRPMLSLPSAKIFSAFASLIPLTVHNAFFGVKATASTVWYPESRSFFVSAEDMPTSYVIYLST